MSSVQFSVANRERVQIHQERLPREDLVEELPREIVLLRVRGATPQCLASHGLLAESCCGGTGGLRAGIDCWRMRRIGLLNASTS